MYLSVCLSMCVCLYICVCCAALVIVKLSNMGQSRGTGHKGPKHETGMVDNMNE